MNHTDISCRFRMLREVLGISQGEFARAIEKTASFIGLIESGKTNISHETVSAVCGIFHVNPQWLLTGEGNMFEPGYEIDPPDRDGVPSRIKALRKEHGLSQAGLAKEIGCSRNQISAVEQGVANASNDLLKRIAARLSVNYRWLLSGTGSKAEAAQEEDSGMEKIYQFFSDDEQARAVVLEAIEAYSVKRDHAVWQRIRETLQDDGTKSTR